jgi:mRNA-degrading endonuclease YafQ of YafQ-DinJ toxin-antitoxin module
MNFEVNLLKEFLRDIKPLTKKYKSLADDLETLIDSLELNPMQGTPLRKSCYKIRLAIKGKGKSGGGKSCYICCY